jgi:hypothetical protein
MLVICARGVLAVAGAALIITPLRPVDLSTESPSNKRGEILTYHGLPKSRQEMRLQAQRQQ